MSIEQMDATNRESNQELHESPPLSVVPQSSSSSRPVFVKWRTGSQEIDNTSLICIHFGGNLSHYIIMYLWLLCDESADGRRYIPIWCIIWASARVRCENRWSPATQPSASTVTHSALYSCWLGANGADGSPACCNGLRCSCDRKRGLLTQTN